MRNKIFLAFLLVIMGIDFLFAGNTGKIAGKVVDKETKEPIPFANVIVEGTQLGAATNLNGEFVILNVPPGVYNVTASVVGYQKKTIRDVRVNVDFTTRLEFQLSQGSIDLPPVVVQGERNPLIRQDLTNPVASITNEKIEELPVDQIADVIKLQAGVVVGNDGDLHIRGGYGNEIAYTLNGITLNDPYGNRRAVGLATNAVQEVSVSSGTFSAEYGNALSGVVNYVTKEGPPKFTGSFRAFSGDYVSNRKELFEQIDQVDPFNRTRTEFTLGGPFFFSRFMSFFISSVYEDFKGSLYGRRLYRPDDSYLERNNFRSTDSRFGTSTHSYYFNPYRNNSNGLPTGDGAWVPMNWSRSFNFQGNLIFKPVPTIKFKYEFVYDKGTSQNFIRSYKYNPDGRPTNYSNGLIHALDWTHTLSNNVFYTLKLSLGNNYYKSYLYEDPYDPRYLPSAYSRTLGNTTFLAGGTDNSRFYRKTQTLGIKGDLVAQLFNVHEVKFGFEIRRHRLNIESYSVQVGYLDERGIFTVPTPSVLLYDSVQLVRRIPLDTSLYTSYERLPVQAAAYIQDKIELASSMILNVGLRYEYFNPAAQYNPLVSKDLSDLKAGSITRNATDAKPKHRLSPRISVSYPITDRGVIRFSYGHFYQVPSLASLYSNPYYYVANFGENPTFGNPNVEPQKSVQYELGLQQLLLDDLKLEVTGFYKDVSNYIYTQQIFTNEGRAFYLLTNLAYSSSKGITVSLLKRRSPQDFFSATLDYTFSLAEGNRTYPADELFFSERSGKQSETYLVPFSFDRSHVINATLTFTQPNNWVASFIGYLQTGTPYTPIFPSNIVDITFEQNSARQPLQWNVDFKFEKFFMLGNIKLSLFTQIENLFDTQNELFVYASTGRALSAIEEKDINVVFSDVIKRINRGDPGLIPLYEIQKYYSLRPERVNRPREVRLGFQVIFN